MASHGRQIVRGTRLELHALLPAVPPALLPQLFTALREVELHGDGAHVADTDAAGIRYAPCHGTGEGARPSADARAFAARAHRATTSRQLWADPTLPQAVLFRSRSVLILASRDTAVHAALAALPLADADADPAAAREAGAPAAALIAAVLEVRGGKPGHPCPRSVPDVSSLASGPSVSAGAGTGGHGDGGRPGAGGADGVGARPLSHARAGRRWRSRPVVELLRTAGGPRGAGRVGRAIGQARKVSHQRGALVCGSAQRHILAGPMADPALRSWTRTVCASHVDREALAACLLNCRLQQPEAEAAALAAAAATPVERGYRWMLRADAALRTHDWASLADDLQGALRETATVAVPKPFLELVRDAAMSAPTLDGPAGLCAVHATALLAHPVAGHDHGACIARRQRRCWLAWSLRVGGPPPIVSLPP